MKKISLLLIGFLCLSIMLVKTPSQARAQPSSDIYYEGAVLTYSIDIDGSVGVQMKYTLVNDSSTRSVSWVSYPIASEAVENVDVYDESGNPLQYDVEASNNQTTIKTYFDGRMGPGDQLTYFVTFSSPDLATKEGSKYTGTFGQLTLGVNATPYENYVVNVHGPPGAKLFIYEPSGITTNGENLSYETQLEGPTSFGGVKGTWYQSPVYYKLTLTESISNNSASETTDLQLDLILFNKEDNWQTPALIETSGLLEGMYVDEENNWRGVFKINSVPAGGTREFQIVLVYQASVCDPDLSASNAGDISEVSSEFEPYLESKEYWQSEDSTIQQAAETAVGNTNDSYLAAKKIVGFVNNHLDYEVQSDRLGALQAYLSGKGDCSEYTDLSIALARAKGLPARASYGWGYSENELVGHAWPEFYFPKMGWQPADPTWADTGGKVSPGGLRPRPHPPGKPFEKLAPTLAGTAGSYLGRLDTLHVQRNLRWLNPTESFGEYTYRGAEPTLGESRSVEIITEGKAATDFLSAAQLTINRASTLIEDKGGGSELIQELDLAENYLNQAKSENDSSKKLVLSQQAIQHADKVIRELGEPPSRERGWWISLTKLHLVVVIIIIIVISTILGGGFYAVRKKAEKSSISS